MVICTCNPYLGLSCLELRSRQGEGIVGALCLILSFHKLNLQTFTPSIGLRKTLRIKAFPWSALELIAIYDRKRMTVSALISEMLNKMLMKDDLAGNKQLTAIAGHSGGFYLFFYQQETFLHYCSSVSLISHIFSKLSK